MKAKLTLGLVAAVLVAITAGCSQNSNIVHPGTHLDSIDHASVGNICHSHSNLSQGHHCHDLRSGKEPVKAWY
ncbi:MAG: hypothetical protein ACPGVN_05465 [Alphaproteobacteria bacterium]